MDAQQTDLLPLAGLDAGRGCAQILGQLLLGHGDNGEERLLLEGLCGGIVYGLAAQLLERSYDVCNLWLLLLGGPGIKAKIQWL